METQLELFRRGTQFIRLLRPATRGDGVMTMNARDRHHFVDLFERSAPDLDIIKFIPASGAATRMFKKVFTWVEQPEEHRAEIDAFFDRAEELAFFEQWLDKANELDIETFAVGIESKVRWLKILVDQDGLGLASRPKALIEFHTYDHPATPIEEHMFEAMALGTNSHPASLHFTVSPAHLNGFEKAVSEIKRMDAYQTAQWEVSFSSQDSANGYHCRR